MDEVDENGWAHIHHAASMGFIKSLKNFVRVKPSLLELETGDALRSTPLLLAIASSNLETVQCLVELGASLKVKNNENQGLVELASKNRALNILSYFLTLSQDELPVWTYLVRLLQSSLDEECIAAGACITQLLQPQRRMKMTNSDSDGVNEYNSSIVVNSNCQAAQKAGLITTVVSLLNSDCTTQAKAQSLLALLQILTVHSVQEQFVSVNGLQALVRQMRCDQITSEDVAAAFVIQLSARTLREVFAVATYATSSVQLGVVSALVKVLQNLNRTHSEALADIVAALGALADVSETHQNAVGRESGSLRALVDLMTEARHIRLILAIVRAVSVLTDNNLHNQNQFMAEGVVNPVINLLRAKSKDIQLGAVIMLTKLVTGNSDTQRAFLDKNVVPPLLSLLKKNRGIEVMESAAVCFWALAGSDCAERRRLARLMGVPLLIEFLHGVSDRLHLISAEALKVLAEGPISQADEIGRLNGIQVLVRLLRSSHERIVIAAEAAIAKLCVGVGYTVRPHNQTLVNLSRGIRFLNALLVHAEDENVQVGAAVALASVVMGNKELRAELELYPEFNHVRILRLLYAKSADTRLAAVEALSLFGYNCVPELKAIASQGGMRFSCLTPFLRGQDATQRCKACFSAVILCRVIPDEEQAVSSATGIKLLIELLFGSGDLEVLSLACDCVARLARVGSGVPQAMIAIDAVYALCKLLLCDAEEVRGSAAIALIHLSKIFTARRQLLHACQRDPFLMQALQFYANDVALGKEFLEGWRHVKHLGLPPIKPGRPQLTHNSGTENHQDNARFKNVIEEEEEGERLGTAGFANLLGLSAGHPMDVEKSDDVNMFVDIHSRNNDSPRTEDNSIDNQEDASPRSREFNPSSRPRSHAASRRDVRSAFSANRDDNSAVKSSSSFGLDEDR